MHRVSSGGACAVPRKEKEVFFLSLQRKNMPLTEREDQKEKLQTVGDLLEEGTCVNQRGNGEPSLPKRNGLLCSDDSSGSF